MISGPVAAMARAGRSLWWAARGRLSAIFGGVSGGLGTFGALHNVCHYTCEFLVTGLALLGVTATGLPLAFLEDPRLIVLFGGLGLVSLGANLALRLRARRASRPVARWWRLLDLRAGLVLVFFLASGWSVTQGATRLMGSAVAQEAPTRTSKEGGVEVELTLLNLKELSPRDALVFAITMSSMDMSAPSFETYDLKRAITLEIDGTGPFHPTEVRVSDWGHMGHHLRGQVMFPLAANAAGARVLRVTIRGIGGVKPVVLEWRMPRTR